MLAGKALRITSLVYQRACAMADSGQVQAAAAGPLGGGPDGQIYQRREAGQLLLDYIYQHNGLYIT